MAVAMLAVMRTMMSVMPVMPVMMTIVLVMKQRVECYECRQRCNIVMPVMRVRRRGDQRRGQQPGGRHQPDSVYPFNQHFMSPVP